MRRILRKALLSGLLLNAASAAAGELLSVPGPRGTLQGEAVLVPGARAGIVIIPGSGPTDRDGNSPAGIRSDSYKLLAEGLAHAGFSSLRVDKRGFFGSKDAIADPEDVSIEDYAEDIRLWQKTFAERIGRSCVWLAGHSEGGLVALVAAARGVQACGLILLAAPGRRISDLMREQFRTNPANARYLAELDRLVLGLAGGRMQDDTKISPAIRPLFRKGLQRYMVQLFSYEPAQVARGVTLPVLILQGEKDLQVKSEDARLLSEALPQSRSVLLPGVTHMLKRDVPGSPIATYQNPDLPLAPEIVSSIVGFVDSMTGE
ncbi:MAG TPA: alpha/beta fold hydrolase [Rhizobiaceae bacterium]|nr:alpha/beta fold hydrolase [Rhizobiaceae bacterium]